MALGPGRGLLVPLIFLISVLTAIELAVAGWAFNRYIDVGSLGNSVTIHFVLLSLISGVVGGASVFTSIQHLRVWRTDSLAASGATALIDLFLSFLASGLAAKEIHVGGRDRRLKVLESFVLILAGLKLFKLLILHAGVLGDKYGPNLSHAYTAGVGDQQKSTSATAA